MKKSILVVDDDILSAELIMHTVKSLGYEADMATNGKEALEKVRLGDYGFVISDWEMPHMDGVELCRRVRQKRARSYIYFILLTSRRGDRNVIEGMRAGADDFISKPFEPEELMVRMSAGERVLNLESRDLVIFGMSKLAESRDNETGEHLERMREYARMLAEEMSKMPKFDLEIDEDFVELIYMTSPLHDIGKVGIPDAVLLKPGRLTPEEFDVMKTHTTIGGKTLDAAIDAQADHPYLRFGRDIAYTHHERYDGTGYPNGLAGEDIPLCGRIVALADVYDALTSKRVYKDAFSHEKARSIIVSEAGKHFDPDVVDAFLIAEDRFRAVAEMHQELPTLSVSEADYVRAR
ncbi:MAG: response regulator [bacterium]|nr:response regulator [bacterium]